MYNKDFRGKVILHFSDCTATADFRELDADRKNAICAVIESLIEEGFTHYGMDGKDFVFIVNRHSFSDETAEF